MELICDACNTVSNIEKTYFTPVDGGIEWICRVCDSQYIIPDDVFCYKGDIDASNPIN